MPSGIYVIENRANGKVYVGSAVSLERRKKEHLRALGRGSHFNCKLQCAWGKQGAESFAFKTLLVCSREMLLFYEQRTIDSFDSVKAGYNVAPTAGSTLGHRHSVETRVKLSKARQKRTTTEETRIKMSAAHKGNRNSAGYKQTEEHKAKNSAANKGRKLSAEHRGRIAASQVGRVYSKETKDKLGLALVKARASRKPKEKFDRATFT